MPRMMPRSAHAEQLLAGGFTLGDVRAYRVPSAIIRHEQWRGDVMIPCALDEAPGRGYVRVLIGDYLEPESSSSEGSN